MCPDGADVHPSSPSSEVFISLTVSSKNMWSFPCTLFKHMSNVVCNKINNNSDAIVQLGPNPSERTKLTLLTKAEH